MAAVAFLGRLELVAGVVLCLLAHELAHVAVGLHYGLTLEDVELQAFGGVARFREGLGLRPRVEARVALAGPAASLALAGLSHLLDRAGGVGMAGAPGLAEWLFRVNLTLGAVNMLPGLPLDGGRVLRAALAPRWGLLPGTRAAAAAGQGIGLALVAIAVAGLLQGHWLAGVAPFGLLVAVAAHRERRAAVVEWLAFLSRVEAGFPPPVQRATCLVSHEEETAGAIARRLGPDQYILVYVTDGQGRLVGLLTGRDIARGTLRYGLAHPLGALLDEID